MTRSTCRRSRDTDNQPVLTVYTAKIRTDFVLLLLSAAAPAATWACMAPSWRRRRWPRPRLPSSQGYLPKWSMHPEQQQQTSEEMTGWPDTVQGITSFTFSTCCYYYYCAISTLPSTRFLPCILHPLLLRLLDTPLTPPTPRAHHDGRRAGSISSGSGRPKVCSLQQHQARRERARSLAAHF